MKSIVLNHYNSLLESENEINVWGWKLHPSANPNNYKIVGDFNNIKNWKAKTLVANNGGKIGEFEEVGYIWFNEIDKTFIPISRNDEHHLGGDMMYDMKYTRKDYYPIWLRGSNYVYDDSDRKKLYAILKQLVKDGFEPTSFVQDSQKRIKMATKDFVDGNGKIEIIKGRLSANAQKLVNDLSDLVKLRLEIRKLDSSLNPKKYEKMVKKFINNSINTIQYAWNNWLFTPYEDRHLWDYESEIEKMKGLDYSEKSFEIAEDKLFGFRLGLGFKNMIHRGIKRYIEGGVERNSNAMDFRDFFGDLDVALGIFNKLDMIDESWHGTMKSLYDYNDIFLNPTKKEMKKDLDGLMRGVILPNGDLYVARAAGTIHRTIIKYLIEKGIIEKQYDLLNISRWISPNTDLLFVQNRENDINTFYLAESYSSFWDNDLDDGRLNYLKEIAKKCEAKNNIKIIFKRIWDR